MKLIVAVLMGVILAGCVVDQSGQQYSDLRLENHNRLEQVRLGMNKAEVIKIMGTEPRNITIVVGDFNKNFNTATTTIAIPSPYKTSAFRGSNGKVYEILYYYTDLKKSDGVITDDELTPLIIEDGALIGWGNEILEGVSKVELRMR